MLVIRYRLFVLCALFFISFAYADNYKSSELDKLFEKLSKIENPDQATLIEKKIWEVWSEHPKNEKLTNKLEFGKELMSEGSYNYALQVFTNIIRTDPSWSEAWNARATLFFYMNSYEESLNDIDKVLNLEPRHFGALSGRAQILIRLEQYGKALNDLREISKIHPSITKDKLIEELEKLIKDLSI
jgi:tetratricopeptide (TPR) repeat protein